MKLSKLVMSAIIMSSLSQTLSLPPIAVTSMTAPMSTPNRFNRSCCACHSESIHRYKRSPHGEVSLSPGDPFQSSSQANSTLGEISSHSWPPTIDTLVTVIFRAVVTILSLLNVGFTWRIHGTSAVPSMQEYTWTDRCVTDIHAGHRWRPWRRQRPLIDREWPM